MSLSGGSGSGGQAETETKEAAKEAAPKAEEAPQKKAFDIYLKSFDPKAKLTIIKEMKPLFNLGLKEVR